VEKKKLSSTKGKEPVMVRRNLKKAIIHAKENQAKEENWKLREEKEKKAIHNVISPKGTRGLWKKVKTKW